MRKYLNICEKYVDGQVLEVYITVIYTCPSTSVIITDN